MTEQAKIDDGGPAFPRPASEDKFNEENYTPQVGMTLRDWFAGQALAGLLSDHTAVTSINIYANDAYMYADAMIKARKQ